MTPSQNPAPIFLDEFCHALDPKNRVTIPARWRATEADEFVVIADRSNDFLKVLPEEQFRAVGARVAADPRITPKERTDFLRKLSSSAKRMVADKQGRVLVPEELSKTVGLQGDVVLVGAYESFEIWNPTAWAAKKQADENSFERVADLIGL